MKRLKTGIFLMFGLAMPVASSHSETIKISDIPDLFPITMDIPSDWTRTQIVKKNGIITRILQGQSEMELRNFTAMDMSIDYLINAKAARLSAEYASVVLLLEKSEETGKLQKRTLFWQMHKENKTWYEKTLILFSDRNIAILSCKSPESEYHKNRVVFENAVLSLAMDTEKPLPEKQVPENPESEKDNVTPELIRDIQDTRENKPNKLDKLKKDEKKP